MVFFWQERFKGKAPPNDCNISMQHITTLLGRNMLSTLGHPVVMCWDLLGDVGLTLSPHYNGFPGTRSCPYTYYPAFPGFQLFSLEIQKPPNQWSLEGLIAINEIYNNQPLKAHVFCHVTRFCQDLSKKFSTHINAIFKLHEETADSSSKESGSENDLDEILRESSGEQDFGGFVFEMPDDIE